MKKSYLFQELLSFVFLCLCLSSCSEDSDENYRSRHGDEKMLLLVDTEEDTPYQLSLFNQAKEAVLFMNVDDNGKIYNIDCLPGGDYDMLNITFYDNGLIKSVNTKDVSFVFSNHKGNKVDFAVSVDDDIFIQDDFEMDINWDEYIENSTYSRTRSNTRVGFGKWFDSIADGVRNSSFHQMLYNRDSQVGLILGQIADHYDIIKAGVKDKSKEALYKSVRMLMDITNDGILDLGLNQDEESFYLSMGMDAFDVVMDDFTKWDLLIELLGNYDKYVDWCADKWYQFFEWQDEREEKERIAQAALNSGIGDLKVTLTWNFYADIDLEVMEPDGSWIWWDNPWSYSGGFLDVDNRNGGSGSCENIYWDMPMEGTYVVYLNYYGPSELNDLSQSGYCTVGIFYKGSGKKVDIYMGEGYNVYIANIDIPSGKISSARTRNESNIKLRFEFHNKGKSLKKKHYQATH